MRIWRNSMSLGRRRWRWSWRFVAGVFISLFASYLLISHVVCDKYLKSLRYSSVRISPPEVPLENSSIGNSSGSTLLAEIVWGQITKIQGRDCHTPNFKCGHDYLICGFGCQIHHRAACLMMSYVLNMPLIHTHNDSAWSFSTGFHSFFLPLGSDCQPSSNTYSWSWKHNNKSIAKWCLGSQTEEIGYPLSQGLSVPGELAEAVAKVSQDEFLWWTGQFVKYTLRLNAPSQNIMEEYKRQIGFSSPIVGAHVRRTDKIRESKKSHHELEEYFQAAEEYFSREEESRGVKLPRRIFLASDDSQVLPQARANWTSWEVRGFVENVTRRNERERKDALGGIVRDVYILSSCHFIVCGLSSNVCRLLLELISADSDSSSKLSKLKSLDGEYSYALQGPHAIPSVVNKIPKKNN